MQYVNKVLSFMGVLMFGGWEESFLGADTQGTPGVVLLSILVHGAALSLIYWQSRRHGIQSHYEPKVVSVEPRQSNVPL